MRKKIFITGATGFIGSHLCEMAARKGFNIIGFDRYNPNNDHGWLNKNNNGEYVNSSGKIIKPENVGTPYKLIANQSNAKEGGKRARLDVID